MTQQCPLLHSWWHAWAIIPLNSVNYICSQLFYPTHKRLISFLFMLRNLRKIFSRVNPCKIYFWNRYNLMLYKKDRFIIQTHSIILLYNTTMQYSHISPIWPFLTLSDFATTNPAWFLIPWWRGLRNVSSRTLIWQRIRPSWSFVEFI